MIQYTCSEDSSKVKCYLDWFDIQKKCTEIANIIKIKYKPEEIELIGVSRGGLIPATIIAYKLGVRLKVLDVHSYNDDKQCELKVESDVQNIDKSKKIIIIDDIYDTGQTYKFLSETYWGSDFYFIIDKRDKNMADAWYVFPWEK